ncbi:SMC-Scp complex subunit ScpB [Faecalimonas umbilicata]|uniref:SMC-Scp complex subunit ScpB n=1 Tax=Faecalimonas umbilicata TaxID=1912855 RepID=UPI002A816CAC|nr:SMC-Scp complex subunit ScpB [Faecalimonas umbilicata]MDY4596534.1 SMC-Scp complex subunit ScpB [Faecalimonas umbilicata]
MEKKTEKELLGAVEAILFAMGESVSLSKIASAIGKDETEAKRLLEELKKQYQKKERGIQLIELEDSYQLCTKPELYDYLIQVAKQPKKHVLTDVLLETLAIVAYKQPVTKIEIEKIRGVKSDHAVNKLVEYDLVCEVGRLDAPGKPLLFGTTEEFLRRFGVQSVEELPSIAPEQLEDFKKEAEREIKDRLDV